MRNGGHAIRSTVWSLGMMQLKGENSIFACTNALQRMPSDESSCAWLLSRSWHPCGLQEENVVMRVWTGLFFDSEIFMFRKL